MKDKLLRLPLRLRADLGPAGLAGLALLAAAALFFALVLQPMQKQSRALQAALESRAASAQSGAGSAAGLYRFLERKEETTDWLAKLHAIGQASGVELRSASYRTQAAGTRLERYEIVLPVSGSYAQIRDFLKRALAEIPVLSLDQVSLRRESRNDSRVRAELRLTLHRVKS
jgi:Tfp pilus assembly protein PilO